LPYWKAEGRLGVKSPQGAWNANLFWEHENSQDRLRVSGPFSQGVVSIILQKDLIYINEGNGKIETTRDPSESIKRRLGFEVPVESLRFWMMGLPAPDEDYLQPVENQDSARRGFTQRGWSLAFEQFVPLAGESVPQRILLQGNQVRLKLIIDSWMTKANP
jgi:outer membrane lipoprotein LolB